MFGRWRHQPCHVRTSLYQNVKLQSQMTFRPTRHPHVRSLTVDVCVNYVELTSQRNQLKNCKKEYLKTNLKLFDDDDSQTHLINYYTGMVCVVAVG
jgi:hypothetical protein